MELRQLRAFVAVASLLHFGHAARSLHITQPALSQRIRGLEHELHTVLLIRTTRDIHLTDAGRALLPYAQRLVDLEDRALGEMAALMTGRSGRLRIGYYATSSPKLTTQLVKQFRTEFPGVTVEPSHANSALNLERLRKGDIDIGVVRLPMYDLDGVDVHVIETEPYVVALPSDHRLCLAPAVDLTDLRDELWVMYPRAGNPGHFDYLVSSIERLAGSNIHVAEDEPFEEAQLSSVAAGSGFCLIQLSQAKRTLVECVSFRPIVAPGIMAQFALISLPQERTTAVANFIEMVTRHLDEEGGSVESGRIMGLGHGPPHPQRPGT
jgi:DNA-binding transcriptional LysR family regulator